MAAALLKILYPLTCPVCGDIVAGERGRSCLCRRCVKRVNYVGDNYCIKCGKQVEEDEQVCYDCSRIRHRFTQGRSVFIYDDNIKNSIYSFKYLGNREYADWYGRVAARRLHDQIRIWSVQAIVPVPMYYKKERIRGYNQASLIAHSLGGYVGLPVIDGWLVRRQNTRPMKELGDVDRVSNVENAFTVDRNVVKCRYRSVLLVDDIYTTGATIDSCTKALLEAGVEEVFFICLCSGVGF